MPPVGQTHKSMLMTSYLHLNLAYKGKHLTLSTYFKLNSCIFLSEREFLQREIGFG